MSTPQNPQGTQGLELLLWSEDKKGPALENGLSSDATSRASLEKAPAEPDHLWDEGGDPNALHRQRWGVIAPEGPVGDRLLELAKPLIDLRQQQQGKPVKTYRCPPKLDMAQAAVWRKQNLDTGTDLKLDLPRYQLILGNLDQVPLAIQQVQQSDGYVGRLAFDTEQGYEAYIAKVLKAEGAAPTQTDARLLFYTVHDGTSATFAGHQALIEPGVALAQKYKDRGDFAAREVLKLGNEAFPDPQELLGYANMADPGVLFSLSHGLGLPKTEWRTEAEQRARQGAMSFGRQYIHATDIANRPFLPGGIWFMLACFGAGTPDVSGYRHWLESLRDVGQFGANVDSVLRCLPNDNDRPFIAALPQAALMNQNGPLAFMGHIDLAWTWSFQERDTGQALSRPAKFINIMWSLLKGDRAGVAFRELMTYFGSTNTELTSLYDRAAGQGQVLGGKDPEQARRGHLWMLRQDLAGYILLGDPAVRLPLLAPAAPAPYAMPATPTQAVAQAATTSPAVSAQANAEARAALGLPPPAPLPIDIEELEEAIAHLTLGESLNDLATKYKIDRVDLKRLAKIYTEGGRNALKNR